MWRRLAIVVVDWLENIEKQPRDPLHPSILVAIAVQINHDEGIVGVDTARCLDD
jgi:hypothetical protein